MIDDIDRKHLLRCIELAQEALDDGDEPFGSMLVAKDGRVLFEDRNRVSGGDHTRHPEFAIAKWAAENMPEAERRDAVVYTSGEHCAMCSAAHAWVGLGRIVYAASTQQFTRWRAELGAKPGRVRALAIQDVIDDTVVDGPVEDFAERVKALHVAHYRKANA
ncbi:putative cytidine/deoxycytidylate deaminase [Burkholderia sp. SFA1]|uniref:nucleoside deaminase n=1 Tax=unclassified Caballeronia TaxID=2646786 RepID=UPI001F2FD7B8|nr:MULTISPECIES: nucleoside deaminase [unclassified Caballeronia]MCE4544408.1 nucleoside deaminase [Caballeronia sp. PC1]MCE4571560.1 nucleoside deaminase [Caballeronia sp. CLC5]BBP98526.1 putative cytidine/deoxycytidylate deaminase [Burkholderia sp. SFA1]